MKHLLLTTIATVVLVGCGNPEADWALIDASRDGNIEAVKQHLAAGTDVNVRVCEWGDTPLHRAAFGGNKEIVELLLNNEVDVNVKDDYGCTPLHDAAEYGHKKIIELLISKGAEVNAKDKGRKTPLDVTSAIPPNSNKTEIVDLLRKHGGKTGDELKAEGK